jgi:hypothetical protein
MLNNHHYRYLFILFLLFFSWKTYADMNEYGYADPYTKAFAEKKIVSFEAYDKPGWYIGFEEEEAALLELHTEIAKEYTTFNIVSGLADKAYVSFQFAIETNYYIVQHDEVIKLWEYSAWSLYKLLATFTVEPGLADINDPNMVTFRILENTDMLVVQRDGKLVVEEPDGSEAFKRNATFIIRPPNWDGKNKLSEKRTGKKALAASRKATLALFIFYSALIIIAFTVVVIDLNEKNSIPKAREQISDERK